MWEPVLCQTLHIYDLTDSHFTEALQGTSVISILQSRELRGYITCPNHPADRWRTQLLTLTPELVCIFSI